MVINQIISLDLFSFESHTICNHQVSPDDVSFPVCFFLFTISVVPFSLLFGIEYMFAYDLCVVCVFQPRATHAVCACIRVDLFRDGTSHINTRNIISHHIWHAYRFDAVDASAPNWNVFILTVRAILLKISKYQRVICCEWKYINACTWKRICGASHSDSDAI